MGVRRLPKCVVIPHFFSLFLFLSASQWRGRCLGGQQRAILAARCARVPATNSTGHTRRSPPLHRTLAETCARRRPLQPGSAQPSTDPCIPPSPSPAPASRAAGSPLHHAQAAAPHGQEWHSLARALAHLVSEVGAGTVRRVARG
jgi:hypothetical protein